MTSLGTILKESAELLERQGCDAPRLCAELLAGEVLSLSRLDILVNRKLPVSEKERQRIRGLVRRRAAGEPLAYILGRKEFFGRNFEVRPGVLVPRPETERIVELVKETRGSGQGLIFADICTGSGNLAVTLALELPGSLAIATDISFPALQVARRNISRYGLQKRVLLLQADLTQGLGRACCDLLVANPPYLERVEYEGCGREVRCFEPETALLGGQDGLQALERLLSRLPAILKPGGRFYVEIGQGQPERLKSFLAREASAWSDVSVLQDWQGRPRVLSGQRV